MSVDHEMLNEGSTSLKYELFFHVAIIEGMRRITINLICNRFRTLYLPLFLSFFSSVSNSKQKPNTSSEQENIVFTVTIVISRFLDL